MNSHSSAPGKPDSDHDDSEPFGEDTVDQDTASFGSTLEGLPYIKPFGDVEDTRVPAAPPGAEDFDDEDDD